jgi:hypothetical protein
VAIRTLCFTEDPSKAVSLERELACGILGSDELAASIVLEDLLGIVRQFSANDRAHEIVLELRHLPGTVLNANHSASKIVAISQRAPVESVLGHESPSRVILEAMNLLALVHNGNEHSLAVVRQTNGVTEGVSAEAPFMEASPYQLCDMAFCIGDLDEVMFAIV